MDTFAAQAPKYELENSHGRAWGKDSLALEDLVSNKGSELRSSGCSKHPMQYWMLT